MKRFLLFVLGLRRIFSLRRPKQSSAPLPRQQSPPISQSPPALMSAIDRQIHDLRRRFLQYPNEALLESEILFEQLYSQTGASTQELRVKLLNAQSHLYFRSFEVGTAIEKSRDASAEAWLLEDDALQQALFLEIKRNYDIFIEAAVDKVKSRVAAAQTAIRRGNPERAIQLFDEASRIARENRIAEHPWASRAVAFKGFALYELGRYAEAHKELNRAVRQLRRYWTLVERPFMSELLRKMKLCVGYL